MMVERSKIDKQAGKRTRAGRRGGAKSGRANGWVGDGQGRSGELQAL